MRNLKRVLTLVMAVAMMMSLLVVGAGATGFPDQDKIENTDAVNMNVALGIIKGRDTGVFDPTGNVTRAEMAKMICIVLNGGNEPTVGSKIVPTFTDIKGHWAEGYIEYCVALGIVAGMGDGTFAPNANVTGTQAAKMLLVALGYDAVFEGFNGASWAVKINVAASQKNLYDELAIDPNAALNRDDAAQMVWNTLNAKEVQYQHSLTTVNGQLMNIQTREDKTNDLLKAKFNTNGDYQGIMTGYSWNDSKKEFTYTIAYEYTFTAGALTAATTTTFTSKTDFTALFGMNVNVVHKANTSKSVFGIYAVDSEIVATGVIDDIEYSDTNTIKIDGKSYKVDSTMNSSNKLADLVAFEENKMTTTTNGDVDAANSAYTMKAIDLDGDGKVDYVVYLPFTVGEVTYVGSKTITVDVRDADGTNGTTKSYKFDTDKIYTGVAEDDFVVIVAGANTAYSGEVLKQMDSVSGILNSKSGSTPTTYYLNGKGYDGLFDGSAPVIDNDYTFYVVAGNAYFFELGEAKATIKDLVTVVAYEFGNTVSDDKARVYFTDGTSATINVDKVEKYTNASTKVKITVANDIKNNLYTYKVKDGMYSLMLVNDYNQMGFKGNDAGAGLTKASDKNALIDGYSISDDATVFVQYMDGTTSKVKVLTGAAAQKYKSTGTDSVYLYNTVNGLERIKVALVYGATTEPISEGDIGNYAYVVSTVRTNGDGDKLYTIWNGKANVAVVDDSSSGVTKGSIISYSDNGNGEITDVYVIGKVAETGYTTTTAAITGFSADLIRFTTDLTGVAPSVSRETDEDTVYLYIDSDDVSGLEGGRLRTAAKDTSGDYIINAIIYTDDNDGNVVKLVVIDTINNEFTTSFMSANS